VAFGRNSFGACCTGAAASCPPVHSFSDADIGAGLYPTAAAPAGDSAATGSLGANSGGAGSGDFACASDARGAGARRSACAGERRPINPFLARDPSLRAKRLARALVSDMVAYYPAKHSEGLQRGTLKELFREEIKKSYEEYVAQVGAELARSTTHFQEALNEVLGAGKKIF
jgi:hypothetical protein